jgi:FkbM family methyltransferase
MTEETSSPSVKGYAQKFLNRAGVYHRVKTSSIYDLYWSFADKRIIDDRQREVDFYRSLLAGFRKGDLIFDIGANEGYKTGIFLKLGASVVAVEPDESCQKMLEQKFLKYRLRKKPVVIVPKAVSDRCSIATMWVDALGSWLNTLSQKWAGALREDDKRFGNRLNFGQSKQVSTITMEQLITEHGQPFFVKIDVEGHELSALRGLHRPVPYLSFEVNLPEFRPEGLECVRVLAELAHAGRFNYTSDCAHGLTLRDWVPADDFSHVLHQCSERSIEIFWKTYFG